ncbi:DNA methyltransferase [Bradyrhizobium commune]|uniref:DNA methylase N-4/N-6 domain-containing protein n=1 Tax=Bradyrhizobium commune TaxID=83627 RepID=A0A7S9D6V0_9BRAD|nr:DNA methyltransferase [Bradyrhizobium commune]QPF92312.1 hypothetical protein IC761_03140 [Bradyrhizobium commune]
MAPLDLTRLERIDWNFPRATTLRGSVQSIHWFPGNFIGQIPSALIQVLSNPGDLVLDPFAGSATTAIEALKLKRKVIASDRLSAFRLIANAKLALLTNGLNNDFLTRLRNKLVFEQQCRTSTIGCRGEGGNPDLSNWYSDDTLSQLKFLWKEVENAPPKEGLVLRAIFSDILFQCASTPGSKTRTGKKRRHHWGWVADNVHPRTLVNHNVIELFRERVEALPRQSSFEQFNLHHALVVQQDARSLAITNNAVDLIVTSPPYIGMIDYTHANRLLYLWMNWPLVDERKDEIGARYRRSRRNLLAEYTKDMETCRDEMYRVLRKQGLCAIVLGESQKYPGTATQIFELFSELMPLVWGPLPRTPTRRRVSDRLAAEPIEHIAVFQKL